MAETEVVLYVCPRCFSADSAPGPCPNCLQDRVLCDPGDPENPCRKPPMDAQGRLRSRAPLWWLAQSIPYLREQLQHLKK